MASRTLQHGMAMTTVYHPEMKVKALSWKKDATCEQDPEIFLWVKGHGNGQTQNKTKTIQTQKPKLNYKEYKEDSGLLNIRLPKF